jgi:hypothetical protein
MDSLEASIRGYVYRQTDRPDCEQTHESSLEVLRAFILSNGQWLDSEQSLPSQLPTPLDIARKQRMFLAILSSYFREAQDRLFHRLNELVGLIMDSISKLTDFITAHPQYNIDATSFSDDMSAKLDTDASLTRLTFIRDAIHSRIQRLVKESPVPPYKKMLRSALTQSSARCDLSQNFSKYGQFDYIMPYYLDHPKWAEMVQATVLALREGNALVIIASFAEAIAADLAGAPSKTDLLVVYCGLVRFLFDQVYIQKADLNAYAPQNATFLIKCGEFADTPLSEVAIPPQIKEKYGESAAVRDLFFPKHLEVFQGLDAITNPIDLMFSVHQMRRFVRAVFELVDVSREGERALLMALIAARPPANLVSIAHFLRQWESMMLLPVIAEAQELLFEGIEWLCPGILEEQ